MIVVLSLVTGIAASLSMAASEYISTGAEETEKKPGRAAIYTGHRICRHRCVTDHALSADEHGSRCAGDRCSDFGCDHCALQFLYLGSQGRKVQQPLLQDGRAESWRSSLQFPGRFGGAQLVRRGRVEILGHKNKSSSGRL